MEMRLLGPDAFSLASANSGVGMRTGILGDIGLLRFQTSVCAGGELLLTFFAPGSPSHYPQKVIFLSPILLNFPTQRGGRLITLCLFLRGWKGLRAQEGGSSLWGVSWVRESTTSSKLSAVLVSGETGVRVRVEKAGIRLQYNLLSASRCLGPDRADAGPVLGVLRELPGAACLAPAF